MDIARLFRNGGLQNSPHGNFRIGRPQYFHNFSLPQEKPAAVSIAPRRPPSLVAKIIKSTGSASSGVTYRNATGAPLQVTPCF